MIGKYRKLEGMRKTGEHFQLQIHLELVIFLNFFFKKNSIQKI